VTRHHLPTRVTTHKTRTKNEIDKTFYTAIDRIAEEYARTLKRQVSRMKRIMRGVYLSKVAPLIRECFQEINRLERRENIKLNSAYSREMERIIARYSDLANAEITAAMAAVNQLWTQYALRGIVMRFVEATSEAQRRIFVQEIISQAGIFPDHEMLAYMQGGVSDLEHYEAEVAYEFLENIPKRYEERIRRETDYYFTRVLAGWNYAAIAAALNNAYVEIGEMADRQAVNIAQAQADGFYTDFCKKRQTNLGIDKFIWVTMRDAAVRGSHGKLDTKVFSWETGAVGAGDNGWNIYPSGNPHLKKGDWGCRCKPMPYIENISQWIASLFEILH